MTATALANYMILRPDAQDKTLQDSRFSSTPIVAAYGDAVAALIAYNLDFRRSKSALDSIKAALTAKATDMSLRPKVRDEARRCLEVIGLFEANENALGLRSMRLLEPPKFEPMMISGVTVSLRPHFIVETTDAKGSVKVGAGILRLAKTPDPDDCKTDETRRTRGEHRREMGKYFVTMLQLLLEEQWHDQAQVTRDLCLQRMSGLAKGSALVVTIRHECAR